MTNAPEKVDFAEIDRRARAIRAEYLASFFSRRKR